MTAINPASDLATKLAALSPFGSVTLVRESTGAVGENLFLGPVREARSEVPVQAVFVQNRAGPKPEPYLNNLDDWKRFQLEVTVRSGDYFVGEQLALDIMNQLQRKAPTGYTFALLEQSGPEWAGEDDERNTLWQFRVELGKAVTP